MGQLLSRFGITYTLRPAESDSDKGGESARDNKSRITLGATVTDRNGMASVGTVFDNGAAQQAGLATGDLICAIDNVRITCANLQQQIDRYAAGDTVVLHAFRHDHLMTFRVTLKNAPADRCVLALNERADSPARERCSDWLKSPAF